MIETNIMWNQKRGRGINITWNLWNKQDTLKNQTNKPSKMYLKAIKIAEIEVEMGILLRHHTMNGVKQDQWALGI
jgi:hypothetical protein